MGPNMNLSNVVTAWLESKGYKWETCKMAIDHEYACIHVEGLEFNMFLVKNSDPACIIYEHPAPQEFYPIDPDCFLKLEAVLR